MPHQVNHTQTIDAPIASHSNRRFRPARCWYANELCVLSPTQNHQISRRIDGNLIATVHRFRVTTGIRNVMDDAIRRIVETRPVGRRRQAGNAAIVYDRNSLLQAAVNGRERQLLVSSWSNQERNGTVTHQCQGAAGFFVGVDEKRNRSSGGVPRP